MWRNEFALQVFEPMFVPSVQPSDVVPWLAECREKYDWPERNNVVRNRASGWY